VAVEEAGRISSYVVVPVHPADCLPRGRRVRAATSGVRRRSRQQALCRPGSVADTATKGRPGCLHGASSPLAPRGLACKSVAAGQRGGARSAWNEAWVIREREPYACRSSAGTVGLIRRGGTRGRPAGSTRQGQAGLHLAQASPQVLRIRRHPDRGTRGYRSGDGGGVWAEALPSQVLLNEPTAGLRSLLRHMPYRKGKLKPIPHLSFGDLQSSSAYRCYESVTRFDA
jgi:hypothetical protein